MPSLSRNQFQQLLSEEGQNLGGKYKDPCEAAGRCGDASIGFHDRIDDTRLDAARVVELGGYSGPPMTPATEKVAESTQRKYSHVVAEVDVEGTPTVVDWTARQFNPQARVPSVSPADRYYSRWGRKRDITEDVQRAPWDRKGAR